MRQATKQLFSGIVLVFLALCLLLPLIWTLTDQLTLLVVTRNLGIEWSTSAMHSYVKSSIQIGETRAELHEKLARITVLRFTIPEVMANGDSCENIGIYTWLFPSLPENWFVCYSPDMKVISADRWS